MKIGDKFHVFENVKTHLGVYNNPVIIKGTQCAGFIKNTFPCVRMTNGYQILVNSDDVKIVGTLVITKLK